MPITRAHALGLAGAAAASALVRSPARAQAAAPVAPSLEAAYKFKAIPRPVTVGELMTKL